MHRFIKKILVLEIILLLVLNLSLLAKAGSDFDEIDGDEVYSISVLSPNGGEQLHAGTVQEIEWYAGSGIEYVRIEYSPDDGKTWTPIVNNIKMYDTIGYYRWKVPCGTHEKCWLKISDAFGTHYDYSFGSFSIVDLTAPKLSVTVDKTSLWPPDHQFVDPGLHITVEDNCDPNPHVAIRVTSDEPTWESTPQGKKYSPDAIVQSGSKVLLRAERSKNRDGRVYAINVRAYDASQNKSESTVFVEVRKNPNTPARDSGQFYDATIANSRYGR